MKSKFPPSLIGLAVSSLLAIGFSWPLKTIGDLAGKSIFTGGLTSLPKFVGLPSLSTIVSLPAGAWAAILSTAVGISFIATLETLLANRIACDNYRCQVDVYEKDDPNRTAVGLGVGTLVSSLFGGFGGCGLIPNTLLNGKSGGEGYASSYSYVTCLALSVVVLAPLIGSLPLPALAGLMLTVALNTFEWKETFHLLRRPFASLHHFLEALGMICAMVLCYQVDMGVGVLAGVFITKGIHPIITAVGGWVNRVKGRLQGSTSGQPGQGATTAAG